ncbi:MAG: nitrite reductase (NAD(P)H) small subunit [Prevotellaceae bacterium]|jgi:nitrite reductase/ring-hydroxylating ferredoxin subunit|nr:nitrite reductase (NAD(P)H) small subunit [Prevotellaceae bacterium]
MLLLFRHKKKLLLCLSLAALAAACTKEYDCPVPGGVRVDFDVCMPAYDIMKATVRPNSGYNQHGVIVFRYHNAPNEVFAFDATCPNSEECLASGVVAPVKLEVYAECRKCKSRYSLIDGRHTEKKIKLRAYFVIPMLNATDCYYVRSYYGQ